MTTWADLVDVWAGIGWLHPWLIDHEDDWQQVLVDAAGTGSPGAAIEAMIAALGDSATWVGTMDPPPAARPADVRTLDDLPEDRSTACIVDVRGGPHLAPLWDWLVGPGKQPVAALRCISRVGWSDWPVDYCYSTGHQVRPAGGPPVEAGAPLVLIVDEILAPHDVAVLAALRQAGRISLVSSRDVTHASTSVFGSLPGQVRVVEALDDQGRPFSLPDAFAEGAAAFAEARSLLESWPQPPSLLLGWQPPLVTAYEDSFAERLAAVGRVYQLMRYAYGYPHLCQRPWEEVLAEAVSQAEVSTATHPVPWLVVLVKALADHHCNVALGDLSQEKAQRRGPLLVMDVEGEVVITDVLEGGAGLHVGDRVVTVDGVPVGQRRTEADAWRAASTPGGAALVSARQSVLCSGETIHLEVERAGQVLDFTGPTTDQFVQAVPSSHPTWTVLPEGVGYIDLTRLEGEHVDEAFDAVAGTDKLVLDMRGYPRGTAWAIAPRLAVRTRLAAEFRVRRYDPEVSTALTTYTVEPTTEGRYDGRVAVLIDARAISQSEHSCLLFEAAADVTFIGSTTAGANGETRGITLRSGDRVSITPMDVRHGDGRQLQGVGIIPHLPVPPTIAGVRAGRDEVLEAAVTFLCAGD